MSDDMHFFSFFPFIFTNWAMSMDEKVFSWYMTWPLNNSLLCWRNNKKDFKRLLFQKTIVVECIILGKKQNNVAFLIWDIFCNLCLLFFSQKHFLKWQIITSLKIFNVFIALLLFLFFFNRNNFLNKKKKLAICY